MKLHLPKYLLVAALVAISAVSSFAAEYTVGTITTSQAFPSSSDNIWTPGTADGSLTLGTGDWLGAKDANGNRITSFGKQQWDYVGVLGLGKWTQKSSGTVTQNAQFSTLTINGGAQVVLGGQYVSTKVYLGTAVGSMAEYTGVIADHVVVNGDGSTTNLNTWNLTTDTLVVNSGKVQIHNQVQSGNNHFVYELPDSKQVRIHEGLTVNGGEVIINLNSLNSSSSPNSNPDDTHIFTGFGTINFDAPSYEEGSIVDASKASIVKSWITQTDGSLVIQGKTASVGGLNINQTGGVMSVSTAGSTNHCWHILSDFGDSSIEQFGDSNTVLNIGGIAAYNDKYSKIKELMESKGVVFDPTNTEAEYNGEVMDLNASVNITQYGAGSIKIYQGIDLNNYNVDLAGVASKDISTITQADYVDEKTGSVTATTGTIELSGTYKGASFNITQSAADGTIKLHGTMNGGVVAQTAGTLTVSDKATLNAESMSVGGTLTNSGTVQATGKVTATGTLTNEKNMAAQELEIKSGTTTNAAGATLTAGSITVNGGTFINYGNITSANGAMMLAEGDDVEAIADTTANLITIASGEMKQYGVTTENILVKDGGALTLNADASVGAVTLEQGGKIDIAGNASTGALTLEGGTITFVEGASLTSASATGLDKVEVTVKLSDATLNDIKAGNGYANTLFTVANNSALDGTTVTFTSATAGSVQATVNQDATGAVTIGKVVPEPATATLSLLALAALAARRRRK